MMAIDLKKARASKQIDAGAAAELFARNVRQEWFNNWKKATAEDLEKAFVIRLSRELCKVRDYQKQTFKDVALYTFLQLQSDMAGTRLTVKQLDKRHGQLAALMVAMDLEARRTPR